MSENDVGNGVGNRFLNRPTMMVVAAVVFGLVAALLASFYIRARGDAYLRSLAGGEVEERSVVVASAALAKGTVVSERYFSVRPAPANLLHADAIQPADFERVKGRVLVENMRAGTPLLASFLEDGFPTDFSDTLKPGRRAITIQVDELNAIGGLLRSGDTIDLYVLISPAIGAVGARVTPEGLTGLNLADLASNIVLPVLQNVQVLATGEEASEDYQEKLAFRREAPKSRYSNITVNVNAREGALLSQALDQGDLIAMLRNRDDESLVDFDSIGVSDLFANARDIAAQARQDRLKMLAKGFVVDEDGTVRLADGTVLEGATLLDSGFIVGPDGQIYTADGQLIEGAELNANGEVVTPDGHMLVASEITIGPDGQVRGRDGQNIAGLNAQSIGDAADALSGLIAGSEFDPLGGGSGIDFLAGGNSKHGIVQVSELPILD